MCLKLDAAIGKSLSAKWVDETMRILSDELSALQELILGGDDVTAKFQAKQLSTVSDPTSTEPKPVHEKDKSALHYAVLTGRPHMVEWLLDNGFAPNLSRNDLITGFTPLHLALFTQNTEMMVLLLLRGANLQARSDFPTSALQFELILISGITMGRQFWTMPFILGTFPRPHTLHACGFSTKWTSPSLTGLSRKLKKSLT